MKTGKTVTKNSENKAHISEGLKARHVIAQGKTLGMAKIFS
jgi:hypothetical protein